MANLLLNPTLTGFSVPPRTFTDNTGNVGYMENPDNWEYVWTPMHDDDPNRVPQSLHRDRGYCIAAGWRVWEAGLVQRGVRLRAGQRYLAKAVFRPDVNFPNGPENLAAVQWRFWIQIQGSDQKVFTDWQSTAKGRYKEEEEHLLVLQPTADVTVDFYFKARSTWTDNVCDFDIYSLTLEEVPADYGTPAYLGAAPVGVQPVGAVAPVGQREPVGAAAPAGQPQPVGAVAPAASPSVGGLFNIQLSAQDIDVIVLGLRSMSQVTPNAAVVAGFNRLADALERAKSGGVG